MKRVSLLSLIQLVSVLTLAVSFRTPTMIVSPHRPFATTTLSRGVTQTNKMPNSLHVMHDAARVGQSKLVNRKPATGITGLLQQGKIVWDFTRPHTIIGSCISVVCLFLFAVPSSKWNQKIFIDSILGALTPALFMNLYITGLNQLSDIKIDEINKPYLPLASGKLSRTNGLFIVLGSLLLSLWNVQKAAWPLQFTLLGSALLGTLYSLPPFRLKRFPLLAAL